MNEVLEMGLPVEVDSVCGGIRVLSDFDRYLFASNGSESVLDGWDEFSILAWLSHSNALVHSINPLCNLSLR